jgi:hypothetical protein
VIFLRKVILSKYDEVSGVEKVSSKSLLLVVGYEKTLMYHQRKEGKSFIEQIFE